MDIISTLAWTGGGLILGELLLYLGRRAWRRRKGIPEPVRSTTPPGKHHVVLYDGHCRFCTAQMKNLRKLAVPGTIEMVSFQEPGALDAFPGITHDACMRAMQLITPSGRVYQGFAAAAHAVATRPIGFIAYGYYLPGVHMFCEGLYALIAANRYRLMGKAIAEHACEDGACALHFQKR
jgi:predicted DCC family thiol-disulfide oxidoreductase YuxK